MTLKKANIGTGMRTSPWVILGATAILVVVVMSLAFQNVQREKRHMTQVLAAEGAALIRAVEAGTRTGMMGGWGVWIGRGWLKAPSMAKYSPLNRGVSSHHMALTIRTVSSS